MLQSKKAADYSAAFFIGKSNLSSAICISLLSRQTNTGKLPACRRREEIAISDAAVSHRCHARRAAQYILVRHELAVIFPQCAGCSLIADRKSTSLNSN